jgi:hypothetical protein
MRDELVSADEQLKSNHQSQDSRCPGVENSLKEAQLKGFKVPSYKNFSQIFWIDSSGMQIYKLNTLPELTCIRIRERPYFTETGRSGASLWGLPGDKQPFFVQSVRSYVTAELETVLSIPSRLEHLNNTGLASLPHVAAITAPLVSVNRPFLPTGYDFAVIASDGQVLYHSDPRRTLKEDFFAEVEDPEEVHSAILANTESHFTTMYSGQRTEVFIRPLFGTDEMPDVEPPPWFDNDARQRLVGRCEHGSAGSHGGVVFGRVGGAALVYGYAFLARKRVLAYSWPDSSKNGGLSSPGLFLLG